MMSQLTPVRPVHYLSAASGNAIISEMRPTTMAPSVLLHINLLLDEVMSALLTAAQSLNPKELRSDGVPAVFSSGSSGPESTGLRSFARECVAEAELEVRSWHELNPGQKSGFPPGGKGRGLTAAKESSNARFPHQEALEVLRLRCSELSVSDRRARTSYDTQRDHLYTVHVTLHPRLRRTGRKCLGGLESCRRGCL